MHLTAEELHEITGYRHHGKIREALVQMGILFKVRPADRFTLVDREYYREVMRGTVTVSKRKEPNWGVRHGTAA